MPKMANIGNIFILLRLKLYTSHSLTGPPVSVQKEASTSWALWSKSTEHIMYFKVFISKYQYICISQKTSNVSFSRMEIQMWQQPSGSYWWMDGGIRMNCEAFRAALPYL